MKNPAIAVRTQELKDSIDSIRELVPGLFYTMDYKEDYSLEEVVRAGIPDSKGAFAFALKKWLDPKLALPLLQEVKSGCSAFCAGTPEGLPLFGRNYDIIHEKMTALLVKTTPKDGYRSFGIADLGWIGYGPGSLSDGKTDLSFLAVAPYVLMDGMNEKGLCVAVLSLKDEPCRQNTGKTTINTTTAIRLMLDKTATVEEAVELLSGYDMQASSPRNNYHYLIKDAKGDSRVIEYVNHEMKVTDGRYLTNHYVSPGSRLPVEHGNSLLRYGLLGAALELYGQFYSVSDAMSLLKLVAQSPERGRKSHTRWSEVFNQKDLELTVSIARDYDKKFSFKL